ncbi:MAG: hypothetical protein MH137_09425 [Flavobacteriales bacterium]|nr:hypothetical protein [Flavobacteriales bacterium]
MKNKVLLVAFMAIGIAFTGCKKEKGEYDIEINSPEKDMSYSSPVPLDVHIHGEDIIHDIEIKVFQKSDPAVVVFDYDNHVEVKDFEVTDVIQANVIIPTIFTIWVKVGEDDHVKEYSHDFTIM